MDKVILVNPDTHKFELNRDLSVTVTETKPGPPERIDGMTIGFVTMEGESPHNGEMHPDGDEILYVISGEMKVSYDSAPDDPLVVSEGQACVVRRGEWHNVEVTEKTKIIHITPGPDGDFRPK